MKYVYSSSCAHFCSYHLSQQNKSILKKRPSKSVSVCCCFFVGGGYTCWSSLIKRTVKKNEGGGMAPSLSVNTPQYLQAPGSLKWNLFSLRMTAGQSRQTPRWRRFTSFFSRLTRFFISPSVRSCLCYNLFSNPVVLLF